MDSINAQQPEDNHEDRFGPEALRTLRDLVDQAQSCFFCTHGPAGSQSARPMAVREVDGAGDLWFLSANDSRKNLELALNPAVTLFFQGSPHSGFLQLQGRALISNDPVRIAGLWSPILKTWFTEGKDDPRISIIRVRPTGGYYWDTKHGAAVAGLKMLVGAALGKTLDDSVEGRLRP